MRVRKALITSGSTAISRRSASLLDLPTSNHRPKRSSSSSRNPRSVATIAPTPSSIDCGLRPPERQGQACPGIAANRRVVATRDPGASRWISPNVPFVERHSHGRQRPSGADVSGERRVSCPSRGQMPNHGRPEVRPTLVAGGTERALLARGGRTAASLVNSRPSTSARAVTPFQCRRMARPGGPPAICGLVWRQVQLTVRRMANRTRSRPQRRSGWRGGLLRARRGSSPGSSSPAAGEGRPGS